LLEKRRVRGSLALLGGIKETRGGLGERVGIQNPTGRQRIQPEEGREQRGRLSGICFLSFGKEVRGEKKRGNHGVESAEVQESLA